MRNEEEEKEEGARNKMKSTMPPAVPTQCMCGLTLSMAESSVLCY